MINTAQGNALDDVSFNIKKGEIVGVIGRNGSGKSTLLKLLVGVFRQDSGTVNLHNNSISLAAIGVGFLGKLTGRENIILSGILLGFSKKELLEKQDEIIAFADLGDFIDRPVRTYSSGMRSKLAFSIVAILETDIILIDEVLSVGDAKFRKKSYAKMLEIIKNKDRTVVFVSHNNQILKELCDSIIWLDNGKVKMIGNTDDVMKKYIAFME
ncbi:ATP-binding cassette domain-containing protein [Pasteurella atlantica]|uniref:ATP-binding cassette domain-containing protein n=2 Tax=Pasteurellaceae TaxID=712 RepID=A0ACC6HNV3_9PAST|nr:ATP-binding cassette domain-containing protein [Pasteurella atlantica]MDP8052301.1 ATP-binding cassette domain-containing protein [Pasteurella atlantica]MDP8101760.1 ATP-binding cassette domain-containing protein [Pasteurella atlantica]MDP8105789.1 ATP-binding cassette domain-containing protein [Pasteurella atlantica]MDP8149146.1 ATP-binding cassette domain-containing protein [Pasteurella atlantica]